MYLLDTNIVSELMRKTPHSSVETWVDSCDSTHLFLSAVSEAELRYSIEILPSGNRKSTLTAEMESTFDDEFLERIIPFDSKAAEEYARIAGSRQKAGRPIETADAQIAAIARSRGMALVTRNVRDFEGTGVIIINPWTHHTQN